MISFEERSFEDNPDFCKLSNIKKKNYTVVNKLNDKVFDNDIHNILVDDNINTVIEKKYYCIWILHI